MTAVVQILIIPWAQQRGRRRERWERDVVELQTLLEQEFDEATFKAQGAAQELQDALMDTTKEPGNHRADVEDAAKEAETAMEALLALDVRLWLLVRRVELVNRSSPVWRQLTLDVADLSSASGAVAETALSRNEFNGAEFEAAWTSLKLDLYKIQRTFAPIAAVVKPPPTSRLSALAYRRRERKRASWLDIHPDPPEPFSRRRSRPNNTP
ncbi:hypothetical protein [Actinoplanes regularis]|uniref:hypothetical protein n=1 Tax=Actinoplanes regularis TaxID=52697 RepID=UPI0011789501|nr:hypothetical protein [Actinoplanes regularis]